MIDGDGYTVDEIIQFSNVSIHGDNNASTSRRKKSKSKVWEDFIPLSSGGKVQKAECRHCGKRLSGKGSGGTSHLCRHLKICPARPRDSREQQIDSSPLPESSNPPNWKFDQEKSVEDLTTAIISGLCPFSIVNSSNFKQFLAGINPAFNMVPMITIEEQLLCIFHKEKVKLKDKIKHTPGGVFLSVGKWSLVFSPIFLCLTVHFIDEDWKMNRRIISCRCVRTESGETYDEDKYYYVSLFPDWNSYVDTSDKAKFKEGVQDWGIVENLLGTTSERAVNNEFVLGIQENLTGRKYLLSRAKVLTLPCMVDALRIICTGLKETILETSRACFCYMTSSGCKKKYQDILSKLQLNRPSFGSYEWYRTFYLLEAALQFRNEFPGMFPINPQYYDGPSSEQLAEAEIFCKVMKPIYQAIDRLCNTNTTSNAYFHVVWSLRTVLQESSSEAIVKRVVDVAFMRKKFEELWKKWYLWLSIAVVLDPRYKMRFINLCFWKAFGNNARAYIVEVRGKIYELFTRYSCNGHQQNNHILNRVNNEPRLDMHDRDAAQDSTQSNNELTGQDKFKELNDYLRGEVYQQIHVNDLGDELPPQNCADYGFNILNWWKDNTLTYPTLSAIARDVLAIPGSAVSSEAAFDEGDERARLFMKNLSPEIVEAIICTQTWI